MLEPVQPPGRRSGPGKPAPAHPGRPTNRREVEVVAGRVAAHDVPVPSHAVLDPFQVAARGEELLRQELGALSPMHLRVIARAYGLIEAPPEEVATLDADALRRGILAGVRARRAADDSAAERRDAPRG